MDWSEHVVAEFGQQIGMQGLTMNEDGRLQLILDDEKIIGMIRLSEIPIPEFVVYISQPCPYISSTQLKTILRTSNFRISSNWPLQVGLSNKNLFLALRLPQRAISLSSLNQAIFTLKNTLSSILS